LSSNNAIFPYLKKEEYETWAMKMEYWIMNTYHNLWKIIQNRNIKKSLRRDSKGEILILPPVSFEEQVKAKEPKAMVSVDSMLNWNEREVENKTEKGEQVYGLMAGYKSDFADHAGNAAGSVYDAAAEFAM
nr:hypothetical protein [Tanacetum cinerariifolium]